METKSDGAAKELKPKRRSGNKQKVVAIIILTVCILVLAAGVAAGIYFTIKNDRYSGYVTDGNGMPLEGVAVTNGRDVVKTDENGHYVMDGWLKDRFVTVTIPTGYWTEDYYMEVGDARDGYDFTLEKLDEDYTNHTFLQVSDSEVGEDGVGEWIDNVKQTAEETNAAFIIHTGDICYEDGLRTHLSGMNSGNMPAPVRYIMGNHDYAPYIEMDDSLREKEISVLQERVRGELAWVLLLNQNRVIKRGNDSIAIAGVENQSYSFTRHLQYGDLKKALKGVDGVFTVLLSHDPTHWRAEILPETGVPLTLSGHTHAAQIKIFGFTPASWVFKETDGLYEEDGRYLYVNIGLGGVVPFRLGATPEITVIDLHCKR